MNSSSSGTVQASSSKPFCDLCWKRDGKDGLTLLRCKKCLVLVHKECYGWREPPAVANKQNEDNTASSSSSADGGYDYFTCWACLAVGSVVKVRERENGNNNKRRKHIKITARPTECCLCSVDEGMDVPHAMHPVFDDYGPRARQILLPAEQQRKNNNKSNKSKEERTAWAHTLCAMTLSRRAGGCVYGLTRDGQYDADNDDDDDAMEEEDRHYRLMQNDDDDDDNSINSVIQPPTTSKAGNSSSSSSSHQHRPARAQDAQTITHFAITSKKFYKPSSPYIRDLMEYQQLKCEVCGKNDSSSPPGCYRIPIQCMAGQEDEFEGFKGCHDDLGNDTCYQAMHIGCAFYGKNDAGEYPGVRRVWYFPGDEGNDPVANIFCPSHATDLIKVPNSSATVLKYPGPTAPLFTGSHSSKNQSRLYLREEGGSEKQQQRLSPHPPSPVRRRASDESHSSPSSYSSTSTSSPYSTKQARSIVHAKTGASVQMPVPPLHLQTQRRTSTTSQQHHQQQLHRRSSQQQQQHPKRSSGTTRKNAPTAASGASSLFFSNSASAVEQAEAETDAGGGGAPDYDADLDALVVELQKAGGKNIVPLKKHWKRKKANWSSDKFHEWFARAEKRAKEMDIEREIIQKVTKAVAQLGNDKMKDLELVRDTVGELRPGFRKQLDYMKNEEFKSLWKHVRKQVGANHGMGLIPPMSKKGNSEQQQQQQQGGPRKPPPEVANALAAAAADAAAANDALAGPPIKKKQKQTPVEARGSLLKGAGRLDSDPTSTAAPVARTIISRSAGSTSQDHHDGDDDVDDEDEDDNHAAIMPMDVDDDDDDDEHGNDDEPQKEPLLSVQEARLRKIVQKIDDESEASGHAVPLQTIIEQNREKWEHHLVESGHPDTRLTKVEFEALWERVNRRACENWEQRIQTKPMDWSFLVFGKQFDAKKATDYFGGWDTIVKASDNDI